MLRTAPGTEVSTHKFWCRDVMENGEQSGLKVTTHIPQKGEWCILKDLSRVRPVKAPAPSMVASRATLVTSEPN